MVLGKLDFPKFTKEVFLAGTLPATSTNYGCFFIADRPCIVEEFHMRYETTSTAAVTMQLRKVASGTTITVAGAGNNMLVTATALNGATATNIVGTVNGASATLLSGESLALVPSGTPTNLANALFSAKIKYL